MSFSLNISIKLFRICRNLRKINIMDQIKQNAKITKKTIDELKDELNNLNQIYTNMLGQELKEENARLLAAVQEAKQKLITLEISKGIPQIPIPNGNQKTEIDPLPQVKTEVQEPSNKAEVQETSSKADVKVKTAKPKKEKPPPKEAPQELPIDVGRLDLRIGKIEDVQKHPDADSLYVSKINVGEDKLRTVCSGLVKWIPIEELKGRLVVVLCNLKPVKMRGINSEAMVMCASSEQGVEVLTPPENCNPGDLIECDGYIRQPDAVMNPKKKIFETVAPHLHTNETLEACYKDVPLTVSGKGKILSKTLKNVPVK